MTRTAPTPRHLWIVGTLALLWNLMGALDYVMTQTRNEAYMGQFSEEQLAYFTGFPAWFEFFWALAVWGGVFGSVLLLLRRAAAYRAFLASFLAMVVTTVHSYGFAGAAAVTGAGGMVFSAVIFLVALALVLYTRRLRARGVLG